MMMLDLGRMTVNLAAIARVEWDLANHQDTAMITFIGGEAFWLRDPTWVGELKEALRLLGNQTAAADQPPAPDWVAREQTL